MRISHKIIGLLIATVSITGTVHAQHYEHKEHHLGPTGLFGITSPTNIKITKVQAGSPADGKIKVGDVIVGAGGTLFKENTRRQLADAIDRAETEEAKGILTLTLTGGKKADLQLKVLGAYSDTAPQNCPKTDAIITQTAEYLVKSGKFGRGGMNIGLLRLKTIWPFASKEIEATSQNIKRMVVLENNCGQLYPYIRAEAAAACRVDFLGPQTLGQIHDPEYILNYLKETEQ